MSEKELAASVVAWLEGRWDIYQEVTGRCGTADIVASEMLGPLLWIIECKTSFSLAVLAQAWHWIKAGVSHMVSVAVPQGRNWKTRVFTEAVAREFGIGVLYVCGDRVTVRVTPRLRRRLTRPIALHEEQKTAAKAGSARGGHWTAFRGTCKAVREFVRKHPGCTSRELVEGIEHHYMHDASARGSLLSWARAGKIEGVKIGDGIPARFWTTEKSL